MILRSLLREDYDAVFALWKETPEMELNSVDDLTTIEVGSMGQQKTTVNPLLPYYEKYSGRVTDDLYNLGLTARKQAAKTEEVSTAPDKLSNLLEDIR